MINISLVILSKEYAGHATEVMRKLDLSSWYGVVIVSGDGLIYEVQREREREREREGERERKDMMKERGEKERMMW